MVCQIKPLELVSTGFLNLLKWVLTLKCCQHWDRAPQSVEARLFLKLDRSVFSEIQINYQPQLIGWVWVVAFVVIQCFLLTNKPSRRTEKEIHRISSNKRPGVRVDTLNGENTVGFLFGELFRLYSAVCIKYVI